VADPDENTEGEATKREGHGSQSVRVKHVPDAPAAELARGTLVGRYVVLDKLGEGGMGIVYGAFDPELDRKVAIKVLQGAGEGGSSGSDQAWLLREAQALARLAHPNIVTVHDVGSLPPGDRGREAKPQVFVAMELVDGMTMREWLKAKARTWREVVPVLLAAGEGLSAAHDVGLVHRDFKPENVLVGNDGRVRVMDFGLARLRDGEDAIGLPSSSRSPASPLDSTKSPLSAELTEAGHVVGTPAYMAPEIYEEHPADATTDQFAFGVTLFESLYHTRPYDKKELQPSRSAPPKAKIPAEARVPAQLQRIALRAIAIDPKQRFASMKELLAQLAIDPNARRRRIAVAAGALGVLAALGGGMFLFARHRSEQCTGAELRLAGAWDGAVKAKVHEAFVKTKKPFAEKSYTGLVRALDAYTTKWTEAVTESCKATRVRGEQTEEVLLLRGDCLDERLEEVRALGGILAEADAGLVEKGDKIVEGLEAIADCANVAMLRSPGVPPADIRDRIIELDKKFAIAKAQLIAGNYLPALTLAQQTADGALAIHWEPIAAEAYGLRGAALLAVGNTEDANREFQQATWAAERGKRDDVVAYSALSTASLIAIGLGKPADAQIWLDLGVAATARVGADPRLEARRYSVASMIAAERGDLKTAVELYEKGYPSAVQAMGGKDVPGMASIEADFATTLAKSGAYGKALPHYEHALALRTESVGEEHPDTAQIMSNLGLALHHTGDLARAKATFARALAIREKLFGKKHPFLIATLDNYAELLETEGDHAGAVEMVERAVKIAEVVPGKSHPAYHQIATDSAKMLTSAGRYADAHRVLDEVFEIEDKTQSSILPQTQTVRATLAIAEKAWPDAESYAQKAVATFEAQGGPENPALWNPLTVLARAKIGGGNPAAARPLLERAIAIGEKASITDFDLKPTRELLASLPRP
jgi:tetratricopeptide (TPR) repeat protein